METKQITLGVVWSLKELEISVKYLCKYYGREHGEAICKNLINKVCSEENFETSRKHDDYDDLLNIVHHTFEEIHKDVDPRPNKKQRFKE